jgi:hypothetical protein
MRSTVRKGFLVQLHGQSAHLRTPTADAFRREDVIKESKIEVKEINFKAPRPVISNPLRAGHVRSFFFFSHKIKKD